MYYRDKGIVLKSDELKEADKLVTLLLHKNGRTKLVFKGVEKPRSKKVSSTEIGTYLQLTYYKKNRDYIPYVSEIKVINPFSKIREDTVKFLYLNYILELFLNFSPENEKNIKMFNFLLNSLIALQKSEIGMIESIVRYIEYRLIQLSGVLPDFLKCGVCNRKLVDDAFIDFKEDNIICKSCYKYEKKLVPVKKEVLKYIETLSRSSFRTIETNRLERTVNDELKVIFHNLIVNYLSKELNSYMIVYNMLEKIM